MLDGSADGLAAILATPGLRPWLPLPLTAAIAIVDARRQIIPDGLNAALAAGGAAIVLIEAQGEIVVRLGGAALVYLGLVALCASYRRLRGRTGLGRGDVKFMAASCLWTGLGGLPVMVLAASLSALAYVGTLRAAGRPVTPTTRVPFGPFLALGLHASLAWAAFAPA